MRRRGVLACLALAMAAAAQDPLTPDWLEAAAERNLEQLLRGRILEVAIAATDAAGEHPVARGTLIHWHEGMVEHGSWEVRWRQTPAEGRPGPWEFRRRSFVVAQRFAAPPELRVVLAWTRRGCSVSVNGKPLGELPSRGSSAPVDAALRASAEGVVLAWAKAGVRRELVPLEYVAPVEVPLALVRHVARRLRAMGLSAMDLPS